MNSMNATESSQADESMLEVLRPLLSKYGVAVSLADFHEQVNVVFHDIESAVYDQVHADMWNSLPQQYQLVFHDVDRQPERSLANKPLSILDIGCGTGLSATLLLRTLSTRVQSVHLLDTSNRMLELAKSRLQNFEGPVEATHGTTDSLPSEQKFDVIVTCSVLHHIPDLRSFCEEVTRLQTPGGIFVHFQDPNDDSMTLTERVEREAIFKKKTKPWVPKSFQRYLPHRVLRALWNAVSGARREGYLELVNTELLRRGVIQKPMTPGDIWSVTDIHIREDAGISIETVAQFLPEYRRVSYRTYGFYSVLGSTLPGALANEEQRLISEGSKAGAYFAGAWQHLHLP